MAVQTYSNTSAERKSFYDRSLLERMTPNLVYLKYGQRRRIPQNEGDTANFRRFECLQPAVTALTEGTTPTGTSLSVTKVEATVKQYGDYVTISDKLNEMGVDPVLTEAIEVLGDQAALTVDTIVRDAIVSGCTNRQYAGGAANVAGITAGSVLTSAEIKKAVRSLRKNNARPMKDGYYVGIVDPETAYDLQADTLWQDISKYNGGDAIMKGEIGRIHGVRFVQTSNVKTDATSNTNGTLHETMILGQDAYGVPELEASECRPRIIVKNFGSAGSADPLDQRATAGWKVSMACVVLKPLGMVRISHMVSA